jgi:hypothetical protein
MTDRVPPTLSSFLRALVLTLLKLKSSLIFFIFLLPPTSLSAEGQGKHSRRGLTVHGAFLG